MALCAARPSYPCSCLTAARPSYPRSCLTAARRQCCQYQVDG